jgi:O-antigen ligase
MLSASAYGLQIAIVWSIWFSYELLKAKPRYMLVAAYTVFAAAVMIATGTRGALIGIVIAFALTLLVRIFAAAKGTFNKKLLTLGISGAAAALLAVAVWVLLPDDLTVKKTFQSLLHGKVDESNMGRLFAWHCSLEAFKESPLLGIGNGNFMRFIQQNYGHLPLPSLFRTLPHAHNVTLIILSENGIFGIAIAFTIIFMALRQVLRHAKTPAGASPQAYSLIIGFAVMYITSMFDAVPYYPSCIIWGAWLFGAMAQLPAERGNGATLGVKPFI